MSINAGAETSTYKVFITPDLDVIVNGGSLMLFQFNNPYLQAQFVEIGTNRIRLYRGDGTDKTCDRSAVLNGSFLMRFIDGGKQKNLYVNLYNKGPAIQVCNNWDASNVELINLQPDQILIEDAH